jgi:hypothetical protein
MKRQSAHLFVVAVLALLGPLAQKGLGDFILWNDEQLTVNLYHNQGTLYDRSHAFIVPGGSVSNLYSYDSSIVNISGAANHSGGYVSHLCTYNYSVADISGGFVDSFDAHDFSDVNFSGGFVNSLHASACDSSTVSISGGSMSGLDAYDSSTVNISGGDIAGGYGGGNLYAYDSSAVDISGGFVRYLYACDSSTVNISGGSITNLNAYGFYGYSSPTVIFYGQNFRVGSGLAFDGERVLGTGMLSGEWMDGTRWAVNITTNGPTATILAIPESEHRPFCVKHPRMDFNGDCKVDFADLAIMASSWLECNLVPQSACWE